MQTILERLSRLTKVNPRSDSIREELAAARAELAKYPEPERYDSNEYSKFIKWFRLKKRVQNLEEELKDLSGQNGRIHSVYMGFLIKYIVKLILMKILFVISIYYRNSAAVIFTDDISLQPLENLLSFPTGIKNSISIPAWIMSCNAAFGLFSMILK